MLDGTYKKVLNAMPEGVFVFNEKLRVKFTNAAFRRSFSDSKLKGVGELYDCVACGESGGCGTHASCAYCTFYKAMKNVVESGKEQTETMHSLVERRGRTDKLSVRIRTLPVDKKKKLFLGITDGRLQTETEQELLSAQKLQQRLLPAGKSVGGISYAYMYIPCNGIGGDLPVVYELNGQAYCVLSDVAGHGISAGMFSTFVKGALDKKEADFGVALCDLSRKFNELTADERLYITALAVRMDKAEGLLHYVAAGHNAPLLLKNEYGINEIEAPAPPISNWMADYEYEEKEMSFEKGDILALLTDGVTECKNSVGELFGIERAESVLMQSRSAEDFIGKLKSALQVFSGGDLSDDITAIAFDL